MTLLRSSSVVMDTHRLLLARTSTALPVKVYDLIRHTPLHRFVRPAGLLSLPVSAMKPPVWDIIARNIRSRVNKYRDSLNIFKLLAIIPPIIKRLIITSLTRMIISRMPGMRAVLRRIGAIGNQDNRFSACLIIWTLISPGP